MSGICVICKNLTKKEMLIDGKKLESCTCSVGKYDQNGLQGYYSLNSVIKQSKAIKTIQENCDSWDDALKGKDSPN